MKIEMPDYISKDFYKFCDISNGIQETMQNFNYHKTNKVNPNITIQGLLDVWKFEDLIKSYEYKKAYKFYKKNGLEVAVPLSVLCWLDENYGEKNA